MHGNSRKGQAVLAKALRLTMLAGLAVAASRGAWAGICIPNYDPSNPTAPFIDGANGPGNTTMACGAGASATGELASA